MLRAALAIAIVSSVADAAPPPPPAPAPWADWVGDYTGALTWRGCSVAGAAQATIAVTVADAVPSVDLSRAGGGLRGLTLIDDETGWSGRQGDVHVQLARPKPNALDVEIELDSGCMVRGRLTRRTTGVGACDRLVGWAEVEARCTKRAAVEDLAALHAIRWRATDARGCVQRAARLERELIDVGCAPHPDRLLGVRATDCLALRATTARLARCKVLPPQIEAEVTATSEAIAAAGQSVGAEMLDFVQELCRAQRADVVALAARVGCPL